MKHSHQSSNFHSIRARGHENQGRTYGGLYYPKCWKNGVELPARFEANFIINGAPYRKNGELVEGRRDQIRIVAWNPQGVADGKGLADTLAKTVSRGKEMHFFGLLVQSYLKGQRVDGQPVLNKKGEQSKDIAHTYLVKGYENFAFGEDSAGTVTAEEENHNGQTSFFGRSKDPQVWAEERKVRMAQTCDPNAPSYGYARIIVPEGATTVNPNVEQPQEMTQDTPAI